jgi:hypothetical protein
MIAHSSSASPIRSPNAASKGSLGSRHESTVNLCPRNLVEHACSLYSVISTDVNEQNSAAAGFYRRLGFIPTGRSEMDGQGDLIRLSICSGYQAFRPFLHGNQVFSDALRP